MRGGITIVLTPNVVRIHGIQLKPQELRYHGPKFQSCTLLRTPFTKMLQYISSPILTYSVLVISTKKKKNIQNKKKIAYLAKEIQQK